MSWIDKYFAGLDVVALYGDTFGGLMLGLGMGGTVTPVTPAPTVSSVTPNLGASDTPTLVRVKGTGFVNGCTCTIGAASATVTFVSSTLIYASTGATTASSTAKDVVVTNPDMQTGTLAAAFTYYLPTMSGALAGGSTLVTWLDPNTAAACRQGTTIGSTQATNGSNLGYVQDRRGAGHTDFAALVGSSGNMLTPVVEKYGTPDADNGLGYIQGPSSPGSQILISQASVTYDAVVMVIKSSHHVFPASGGCILGAASSPRGYVELDTDFLQNTFVNFSSGLRLTPTAANGQWYAEDGFSGAVDATYSQIGGVDQWHVLAFKLNTPRSEYIDLLSDWGGFSIFDGRLGEVFLLNSSTDADIKEIMRYAAAKWRSQYVKPIVYFDSDSIWSEGFLTTEAELVPVATMAALSSAPQHPVTNFDYQSLAIGGQTLGQMLTRQTWNVVDKFAARPSNVVVFSEWINSYVGGQTAAQINTSFDSYLAAVHAAGGLAVAATPTFSGLETTSGNETDRQTIRSHILASAADVIVDTGSPDGPFGVVVLGGPCNARWYADSPPKTHPTPDGALFLSNVIADGLGPLLATLNGTSPPGPVINLADPVTGPLTAGTPVTFYGANIPNTLTGFDFGATPATSVVRTHSWRLDCDAPAGSGTVSVTFHFSDRADVVFANAYTFASTWTPASVASLAGWYEGSVGYGGGMWNDQSGSGNHLTLTGTTAGAGLNSLATVLFNGSTDHGIVASFTMSSPTGLTVAMVCKVVTGVFFGSYWGLDAGLHQVGDVSGYADASHVAYADAVNITPSADLGAVPTVFQRLYSTEDNTTPFPMTFYLNNVSTGSGIDSNARVSTGKILCIGAQTAAAHPSNIDVAEFIVFGSVLSGTDRANLDNYLKTKYGL